MTKTIVCLKLMTGEEIVGEVKTTNDHIIEISEPLGLESGVDDSNPSLRYVYMSRFAPYAESPVLEFNRKAVIYLTPVSPAVRAYYEASLEYCKSAMDSRYMDGVKGTTLLIEETIQEEDADHIDSRFAYIRNTPTSNTVN